MPNFNQPSGLTSVLVPGQGFLQHDTHYFYTVSSVAADGSESIPSIELDVITSGQLGDVIPLQASGTYDVSAKLPSGVYVYAISALDGSGIAIASQTRTVDFDPSGVVIPRLFNWQDLSFSGVNTIPYFKRPRQLAATLPSGLTHLMSHQGTAYSNASNVLVLFHMTEGTGSTLTDSSFNGTNGTLFGHFTWERTNLITSNSFSVALSGASGTYAEVNQFVRPSGTMEIWFKPSGLIDSFGEVSTSGGIQVFNTSSLSINQTLISDGSGVSLYLNGTDSDYRNRLTFRYKYNTASGVQAAFLHSANDLWSPDQWYHAAISWGPVSGLKLFVNGVINDSNTTIVAPISGVKITLGTMPSGLHQSFKGQLKEFRYLNQEQGTFNVSTVTSGRVETSNYTFTSGLNLFRQFIPNHQIFFDGQVFRSGIINYYYSTDNAVTWNPLTSGNDFREIRGASVTPQQIRFRADLLKNNTVYDDPLIETGRFKYVDTTTVQNTITMSWGVVTSASGYTIHRASGVATTSGFPPNSLLTIMRTGQTAFTDLGGSGLTPGQPNFVMNDTYTRNAYMIRWNPVITSQGAASGYLLYRSLSSGNYPTKALIFSGLATQSGFLDTVSVLGSPSVGVPTIYRNLTEVNQFTNKYRDVGVIGGQTYSYRISAVNVFGVEGPLSDEITITAGDVTAPATPTNVLAVASSNTIVLTWTNGGEVDYNATEIFASSDGVNFSGLATVRGNSYSEIPGYATTRYYKLRNFDFNTNYSPFSSTVSATTSAPPTSFEFSSSTLWVINHNFGAYPTVDLKDTLGNVLLPSGIRHLTTAGGVPTASTCNRTDITWANAQDGTAIVR